MKTISVCMIVKNEEEVLARCLESVKEAADEIILVDTGSTDRTKEIARQFTDCVFDFVWIEDFAAARNFSFSKAHMDYYMWLDADDILLPEDLAALQALKEVMADDTDVVMLPYHTAFDETGAPAFSYYRERLLRRAAGFLWEGAVHEVITPAGKIVYGGAAVTHRKVRPSDPERNLRIYERILKNGGVLTPRDDFYYARELTYHGRDVEAAERLSAFLDADLGWRENKIEACRLLAQCLGRLGGHREDEVLQALLRSFLYDAPRAELCCDVGAYFMRKSAWRTAAFWYETALTRPRDDESGAFVLPDCYGYLPYLQLCVCHYWLGDREAARRYNELAGGCKPQDAAYRYNKRFFEEEQVK